MLLGHSFVQAFGQNLLTPLAAVGLDALAVTKDTFTKWSLSAEALVDRGFIFAEDLIAKEITTVAQVSRVTDCSGVQPMSPHSFQGVSCIPVMPVLGRLKFQHIFKFKIKAQTKGCLAVGSVAQCRLMTPSKSSGQLTYLCMQAFEKKLITGAAIVVKGLARVEDAVKDGYLSAKHAVETSLATAKALITAAVRNPEDLIPELKKVRSLPC